MEFCEGKTLRSFIDKQTKELEESFILQLLFQMANALRSCHKKKLKHGNLMPENIILTTNDQIKLINFNLTSTFALKQNYVSPEFIQQKKYLKECEVWSLGVIFYELLTFKQPFNHEDENEIINKICHEETPSITSHYSPDLVNIVKAMLIKDPLIRIHLKTILRHPLLSDKNHEYKKKENTKIVNLEKQVAIQNERIRQLEIQNQLLQKKIKH